MAVTSKYDTFYTFQLIPTVDTSAYAIGDNVGTLPAGTILKIPAVNRLPGRPVKLVSVDVTENGSASAPAFEILFFRSRPVGGTYTDNSAFAWGAEDYKRKCGHVSVVAGDFKTLGSKHSATLGGIDQVLAVDETDLYLLIVAQNAYDAVLASDLALTFAFERLA